MPNSFRTPEEVAAAWIGLQRVGYESEASDKFWWAFELARISCQEDAEFGWLIVQALLNADKDKEFFPVIAAGPVEDLLAYQGERVIDRVEAAARDNPNFALLLGGVWKSSMSDEIWGRVQAVWDRKSWDGNPAV